jgi:hypothetical protein
LNNYLFFFLLEMVVPEVDKKLLEELEAMGFPVARATRALHYSGGCIVKSLQKSTYISLIIFVAITFY